MTDTGHIGEAIAAKYYQQRGWLLLNHNYRTRIGEIDLILYKDDTLVFAEVKTRTGAMLDRPAAAVDARKQQRLILAAQQYLQCSPYRDAAIRFDVVDILNMVATFRQKEDIEIFGRRLDSHAIKNAATIVALYIIFFFIGGIAISSIEHLPLLDCLFETASAVGTVGLTLGITPTLGIPSQLILILLMFFGRVGGLTLIYAAISVKQNGVKLPLEKITVG